MAVAPFTRRIPEKLIKTVTFDGTAGKGAVGTVAVATVTGRVIWLWGGVHCTTDLTGASATISLGVAGNTAGLIAVTTAIDIDANEWWQNATPELRISPAIMNQNISGNLILTVAGANITAGVLEIAFYFLPLSDNGDIVAA